MPEPPVAEQGDVRPEGREGMVTVYDSDDRYLGCMGRETWDRMLAEGDTRWPRWELVWRKGIILCPTCFVRALLLTKERIQ